MLERRETEWQIPEGLDKSIPVRKRFFT